MLATLAPDQSSHRSGSRCTDGSNRYTASTCSAVGGTSSSCSSYGSRMRRSRAGFGSTPASSSTAAKRSCAVVGIGPSLQPRLTPAQRGEKFLEGAGSSRGSSLKNAFPRRSSIAHVDLANFPFNLVAFLVALAVVQSEGRRLDAVRDIEDERYRLLLVRKHGPRENWRHNRGPVLLIPHA
jgi:hypothetical protein